MARVYSGVQVRAEALLLEPTGGGGAWMRTTPEIGGVRWYFVEARRYIGDIVVVNNGGHSWSGS